MAQSVTIKTNFSPPISFDPLAKKEIQKTGFSFIEILRPSIDLELPVVGKIHYAPAGEPTGYGFLIGIAVGLLALFGAYTLWRKL